MDYKFYVSERWRDGKGQDEEMNGYIFDTLGPLEPAVVSVETVFC